MDLMEFFEMGGSFDSGIQGSETASPQGTRGFTGEVWASRKISPPAGEGAGVRDDASFLQMGGSFDSGIQGSETASPQGTRGFTGEVWASRKISPPAGESAGVRDDASFLQMDAAELGSWPGIIPMSLV